MLGVVCHSGVVDIVTKSCTRLIALYDAEAVPSFLKNNDFRGNQKNGVPIYNNKKRMKEIKSYYE